MGALIGYKIDDAVAESYDTTKYYNREYLKKDIYLQIKRKIIDDPRLI